MNNLRLLWSILIVFTLIRVPVIRAESNTVPQASATTLIYVDKDAAGANNGNSWADAYTTLQPALDWTNGHSSMDFEIWVAEGTYYPDEGSGHVNNAVTETFRISRDNVQLYGGFAATETLRTQRNWATHPVTLSGDLKQDGPYDSGNAYHVFYLDGITHEPLTETTVIDGFIVTIGSASGSTTLDQNGGGLYCAGNGSGKACSPTLSNLTFKQNFGTNGGALYNNGSGSGNSSPVLTNVTITDQIVTNSGGGIYNDAGNGGLSSPTLNNVTFINNSAGSGGGMFNTSSNGGVSSPLLNDILFKNNASNCGSGLLNESQTNGLNNPVLTRVTFIGNKIAAGSTTCADNMMAIGAGFYNYSNGGTSNPTLTDVAFIGNDSANSGGGMANHSQNNGVSNPTLTNVTFSANKSNSGGGMINMTRSGGTGSPTLINTIFMGNWSEAGGGMFNAGYAPSINAPTLINATFSGNKAQQQGGALFNFNETASSNSGITLTNSILWGNVAALGSQIYNYNAVTTISNSDIEGGYAGTANIDIDPQFINPITATAAPTTTGNYRLNGNSPAIDAGNNASVTVATDLDGHPRIVGTGVDMGAYEFVSTLTVHQGGHGAGHITSEPAGIDCGITCTADFDSNAVITLTATPLISSTFVGWSGAANNTSNPITFQITGTQELTATFDLKAFIITPTAGLHGRILPTTPQTVAYGNDAAFAILADPGYVIVDVGVDGLSVGNNGHYTFTNVTADHTLTATFTTIHLTLTATPTTLLANGIATSVLTLAATDQNGQGAPLAGKIATLTWNKSNTPAPVTVTLGADGTAQWIYTAGTGIGNDIITATLTESQYTYVSTTTLHLVAPSLNGQLSGQMRGNTITYIFTVTNTDQVNPQLNTVMSGSIPAGTTLIWASTLLTSPIGGDYGQGYVQSSVIPTIAPGSSLQLSWTVSRSNTLTMIETQAHAQSNNNNLRIVARTNIHHVMLPIVVRKG